MKIFMLLVFLVSMTGCAGYQKPWNPDLAYDKTETALLYSYGALQVADMVSTEVALDHGAIEANPFFGEDPSMGQIAVSKAVAGFIIWSTVPYLDHTQRKWFLWPMNILYGGIVIHNWNVIKSLEEL